MRLTQAITLVILYYSIKLQLESRRKIKMKIYKRANENERTKGNGKRGKYGTT